MPTRARGNVYTLRQIIDLFKEIFEIAKGSNEHLAHVEFYQEYPQGTTPEELTLPAITVRVANRTPTMEKKQRRRDEQHDPNNPGYIIITDGQWYDNDIRFDVWSRSNKQADYIADEFERFVKFHTGILMERGLQNIYYDGMETDETVNWRDTVTHRIVKYKLRTEEITIIPTKTLEQINILIDFKRYEKDKVTVNRSDVLVITLDEDATKD